MAEWTSGGGAYSARKRYNRASPDYPGDQGVYGQSNPYNPQDNEVAAQERGPQRPFPIGTPGLRYTSGGGSAVPRPVSPVTPTGQITPPQDPYVTPQPVAQPAPSAPLPPNPQDQGGGAYDPNQTLGAGSWNWKVGGDVPNVGPYSPFKFSEFNAPDLKRFEDQNLAALSQALGSSEWSPERVAAMKEVQKEQALAAQDAAETALRQRFAAMGRTGSGAEVGAMEDVGQRTIADILGAYRGVNEQAATQRRNELLTTSEALNQALQGTAGRATGLFGAQLAGQRAQAGENQFAKNAELQAAQLALQRALSEGQLGEQARQFDLGSALDWTKLNYGLMGF